MTNQEVPLLSKPSHKEPEKLKPDSGEAADLKPGFLESVFAVRKDVHPLTAFLLALIPIVIILIIWIVITWDLPKGRIMSSIILPGPRDIIVAMPKMFLPQMQLFDSIMSSLMRITCGFCIALAIAFPLGVLMGSFSKFRATFSSIIVIGSYLPIPTLVPLTLVWFGIGEPQMIGFLAIASFVYLLPAIVNALEDVDDVFLNTAYTLGANTWHIVWKILIPISLPAIYNSLRMGYGVGFTWIIMAEMIGSDKGLGYILKNAQSRGSNAAVVYITLGIIILIAFILDKLWATGYRLLFRYKEARQ
jgi:NitT/TauT family transport system permease protein